MTDAVIRTSMGDIAIGFLSHAEEAVANFKALAAEGDYDKSEFHYVIEGFIIQGGSLYESEHDALDDYFPDEHEHDVMFNRPYLVATAGRGEYSHPTQFFITLREAEHLNWNHTIFGEVTDDQSRKVVDEINAVETDSEERPLEPVIINSITIKEQ
jgi:peptidyl-prolyl cis-trans isomerase A (cyclophilin A)